MLAHRLGLKDGRVARIRYGQIKKALTDTANGTPKKPRPTPTKKVGENEGKGRGGKKRKLAAAEEEGQTVVVQPARED